MNEPPTYETCEACGHTSMIITSEGITMVPCPTCTNCATCGGDVSHHMVVPEVASAINVRQTTDPDADVRRAFVTFQTYTQTPARTWEQWLEAWGELTEKERQGWRMAFSAHKRR